MSRTASGDWIPLAPVVGGTVITSVWANSMMTAFGADITQSLDRNGRGGMLVPFRIADGTRAEPGYSWTAEPSSGFYRPNPGDMRVGIIDQDVMRWRQDGTDVWDEDGQVWVSIGALGGRNGLTVIPTTADVPVSLAGRHYHITVGAVTVTLPANPSVGDLIGVSVDNFDTNIIDSNGEPINGIVQNIEMDLVDLFIELQYVNGTIGWEVISQGLSSAVTGGLPAQGTAAGNTLVWDTVTERWVETNFLNVGLDQVVSGLINGDVLDQTLTRITAIAALPGTPADNALYLIPGGGIYLGTEQIAGVGWEAGIDPDSIINSNTGDVVMNSATGNVIMSSLPLADPLISGALWNNAGVVTVSA
jgi:hypothetical protein